MFRVLLIEDNPADSKLIKSLLEEAKQTFAITAAGSLTSGLKQLDQNWDVILLDLALPDSTGVETFQTVATGVGPTPVVVLTGIRDPEVEVEILSRGAAGYVIKELLSHAVAAEYLIRVLMIAIRQSAQISYRNDQENWQGE